jgi:hypothetical protein
VLSLRNKFIGEHHRFEIATVNGETGVCLRESGRLIATLSIAADADRILAVYAVVNPDKLS